VASTDPRGRLAASLPMARGSTWRSDVAMPRRSLGRRVFEDGCERSSRGLSETFRVVNRPAVAVHVASAEGLNCEPGVGTCFEPIGEAGDEHGALGDAKRTAALSVASDVDSATLDGERRPVGERQSVVVSRDPSCVEAPRPPDWRESHG
jgi:hypothetical protein